MKPLRRLFLIGVLFFLFVGCAGGPIERRPSSEGVEEHFAHLEHGQRHSLHGMVLLGTGPYYLEHIPMETAPHDFQIVAEVTLRKEDGAAVDRNFARETFTFRPAAGFSLNDYLAGRLKKFSGTIYRGNFEAGGRVLRDHREIQVEVSGLRFARQLPASAESERFEFPVGTQVFETNVITPERNYQRIRNVDTGQVLWCVVGPAFMDACPTGL